MRGVVWCVGGNERCTSCAVRVPLPCEITWVLSVSKVVCHFRHTTPGVGARGVVTAYLDQVISATSVNASTGASSQVEACLTTSVPSTMVEPATST